MDNPVVGFEVLGKDGGVLQRFYADLFGWKTDGAMGDSSYGLVAAADGGIGGGLGQSQDVSPTRRVT